MTATLALDTATTSTAVALLRAGEAPLEARDDPAPGDRPRHAALVLSLAAGLLAEAGMRFRDLDRIVVGTGPGSFTGLRIGVATARGLAQATGAHLAGASTLQALALAGASVPGDPVLAVLDARRGEAYVGAWTRDRELVAPRAVAPGEIPDLLRATGAGGWRAVGEGAIRFRDQLDPAEVDVPPDDSLLHRVSAIVLAGLEAAHTGGTGVVPDYLRLPDAEISLRAGAEGDST